MQASPTSSGRGEYTEILKMIILNSVLHSLLLNISKHLIVLHECSHCLFGIQVQFMFKCLAGIKDVNYTGCIQSDSMGYAAKLKHICLFLIAPFSQGLRLYMHIFAVSFSGGPGCCVIWWRVIWVLFGGGLFFACRLGKTFQSIVTLWTLLTTGVHGKSTCSRALVLTPSSLVTNWGREMEKWLGGRLKPTVMDDSKGQVVKVCCIDLVQCKQIPTINCID